MKQVIAVEFAAPRTFTVPRPYIISQRQAQAFWRSNRAMMRHSALGYLAALSPSDEQPLANRVEDGTFFLRLAMRYRTLAPSTSQPKTISPA
jgi:hypothetical protein